MLRGISCFRGIAYQQQVFCRGDSTCANAATRALQVAPPGYSEHATGYVVDFGLRPTPGCQDVEPCFAYTEPGRWLVANAPKYGFELSFPFRNVQGVTWEPWHWRWVGRSPDAPGAARARLLFARARTRFAAAPRVIDPLPPIIAAPPALLSLPPALPPGKRRRR
jgi:zinc D-Ala-D-Ala carboxypeptidase